MDDFDNDHESNASSDEQQEHEHDDGMNHEDPEEMDVEEDDAFNEDDDDQDDGDHENDQDTNDAEDTAPAAATATDNDDPTTRVDLPPPSNDDNNNNNNSNNSNSTAPPSALQSPVTPRFRPTVRPEALTARSNDVVPTMAAPQATSINAIAITPDLRYWMTGGSDGYVRKYDGPGTINGKQLLTVAQRHPFVDSVTKAGILMSYWENFEPPAAARSDDDKVLSPVYSLAVHRDALWSLAGLESGGINIHSVRYDEGKVIHTLPAGGHHDGAGHSNAVSVLQLTPSETNVLSGSWDKRILDWDLNTGNIVAKFEGGGGQISAIELRPLSGAPIPAEAAEEPAWGDTFRSSSTRTNAFFGNGLDGATMVNGTASASVADRMGDADGGGGGGSDHESLFGSPAGSLFGDNQIGGGGGGGAFGGDDDNEFSQAMLEPLVDAPGDAHLNGDTLMADAQLSVDASQAAAPPQQQPDQQPSLPADSVPSPAAAAAAAAAPNDSAVDNNHLPFVKQEQQQSPPPQPPLETDQNQQPPPDAATAAPTSPSYVFNQPPTATNDPTQTSDTTFLAASIDGTLRLWDRRMPQPLARISTRPGVPPWCMGACWSPDGNMLYAGRRNGTVEEFSIHHARGGYPGWQPERALRFPAGSGAVSAVRHMPNGRHLVCASHDILRLYDLQAPTMSSAAATTGVKHHGGSVPFLIIPGPPRAGVISQLYIDPTARFMITAAGTRGWEGSSTEVFIGYEIGCVN